MPLGLVFPPAPAFTLSAGHSSASFTARTTDPSGAALATAKFMILHFIVTSPVTVANPLGQGLALSDTLTVNLKNGQQDVFTSSNGGDFWTRPIATDQCQVTLTTTAASGGITSTVTVQEYAHGTEIDLFLVSGPTTTFPPVNQDGTNPQNSPPAFESITNLDTAPNANEILMREASRSVGILIMVGIKNGTRGIFHCTATVWTNDWLLCAAHCAQSQAGLTDQIQLEVNSASFSTEYEAVPGSGAVAEANRPKFVKVRKLVKNGFRFSRLTALAGGIDYSVLQYDPPAPPMLALPKLDLATTDLANGQPLFMIHHPGGRPKQISRPNGNEPCVNSTGAGSLLNYDCDCDNGSSGGTILQVGDSTKKVFGIVKDINSSAVKRASKITFAVDDFNKPLTTSVANGDPAEDISVILVIDTSGSMGLMGPIDYKYKEAQRAISQFITLLRLQGTTPNPNPNNVQFHKVGLLKFSTTPTNIRDIAPFDGTLKTTLVGNQSVNFMGGDLLSIQPDAMTSIGAGLQLAKQKYDTLVPASDLRPKTILLMTDGIQTATPRIQDVENQLTGIRVDVIGFGQETNLDGYTLSRLANNHNGTYFRAGNGLSLLKFFTLAYGNVFETGISSDPPEAIPAGASTAGPFPFKVVGEIMVTFVLGWEHADAILEMQLRTPGGNIITSSSNGVRAIQGETWQHIQVPMPFNQERDGTWEVDVQRQNQKSIRFRGHDATIRAVGFTPQGNLVLTGSQQTLLLSKTENAQIIRQFFWGVPKNSAPQDVGRMIAAALSPDGQAVMAAVNWRVGNFIILWDTNTANIIQKIETGFMLGDIGKMSTAAFSPDGQFIAVGGRSEAFNDNPSLSLQIFDANTGQEVKRFNEYAEINSLAYSPDGKSLLLYVSTGEQNELVLIDSDSGLELWQAEPFESFANAIAFSPRGDSVLVGYSNGQVVKYNAANGELMQIFETQHPAFVTAVTYSPDGRYALSASGTSEVDGDQERLNLILWDLESDTGFLRSFEGHESSLFAVAFSSDGTKAISGSDDNTAIAWNVPDGTPLLGPLDLPESFFLTSVISHTIYMAAVTAAEPRSYYTGDPLYPQVVLRDLVGSRVAAIVKLTIDAPTRGAGNILVENKDTLQQQTILGDQLPPRASALVTLQNQSDEELIPVQTLPQAFELFDDALHYDGAMEPDGIFGNIITGVTLYEGNYTFRAIANFLPPLEGQREVSWSVYVNIAIDPDKTTVTTHPGGTDMDGTPITTITFTPKDGNGNHLGPDRGNTFTINPGPGTSLKGDVRDNGDGSYGQDVRVTPGSGTQPSIVIQQPDRNPVSLASDSEQSPINNPTENRANLGPILIIVSIIVAFFAARSGRTRWLWLLLLILLILVILLLISLNGANAPVR